GHGRRAAPGGRVARLWYRPPCDGPRSPPRPQTPRESRTRFRAPRSRSAPPIQTPVACAWFGGGRVVPDRLNGFAGRAFRSRPRGEGEIDLVDRAMPSVHRGDGDASPLQCSRNGLDDGPGAADRPEHQSDQEEHEHDEKYDLGDPHGGGRDAAES